MGFFSYSSNDVNAEILEAYTGSTGTLPALVMVIHEKVGNKGVFTPICYASMLYSTIKTLFL